MSRREGGDYHSQPPAKRPSGSEESGYTDLHRGLLQILLNERLVLESDLKKRAVAIGARADDLNIDDVVDVIKRKLNENSIKVEIEKIDYEKAPDEDGPDETYFVLRQTVSNEKSEKIGFSETFFLDNCDALKKAEVDVLRRILLEYKKMFVENTKESFSFHFTEEELSEKFCAVALLKKFTDLKWLRQVGYEGKTLYFLGLRTMAEYKNFFFNEKEVNFIPECVICTRLTFFGAVCPNHRCLSTFHRNCAKSYLKNLTVEKCPTCSITWENINLDGTEQIALSANRNKDDDEEDGSKTD